jgi:hypothetical protein
MKTETDNKQDDAPNGGAVRDFPDSAGSDGWDIRLQCTICGFRVRRHRNDYPGFLGPNPKATVTTECSNCSADTGYPKGGFQSLHFIDYATADELAECK